MRKCSVSTFKSVNTHKNPATFKLQETSLQKNAEGGRGGRRFLCRAPCVAERWRAPAPILKGGPFSCVMNKCAFYAYFSRARGGNALYFALGDCERSQILKTHPTLTLTRAYPPTNHIAPCYVNNIIFPPSLSFLRTICLFRPRELKVSRHAINRGQGVDTCAHEEATGSPRYTNQGSCPGAGY